MELGVNRSGGKTCNVFFNVQSPVGPGCANTLEDVQLVQFLLRKLGDAGFPANDADLAAKLKAVNPTGTFDTTTGTAILAFQKSFTGVPDGRVSPARGASYGNNLYAIFVLNYWMRDMYSSVWPRLQDFPDCPFMVNNFCTALL